MKTMLLFALAAISVSTAAFADGQENRGGAYYGKEIVSCDGDSLHISVYENDASGYFTALVNKPAGGETTPFGVKQFLPAPHVMGGGRRYEGKGFALSVCTDCWSPAGIPGDAKVPSLGVDQSVHCALK